MKNDFDNSKWLLIIQKGQNILKIAPCLKIININTR